MIGSLLSTSIMNQQDWLILKKHMEEKAQQKYELMAKIGLGLNFRDYFENYNKKEIK